MSDQKKCECPIDSLCHMADKCSCIAELAMYERNAKLLYLCSSCRLSDDIPCRVVDKRCDVTVH